MKVSPNTLFWICVTVFISAAIPYFQLSEAQGLAFRDTTFHWVLLGAMTGAVVISALAFYQTLWRPNVAVKFQGVGTYLVYLLGVIAVVTLASAAQFYIF